MKAKQAGTAGGYIFTLPSEKDTIADEMPLSRHIDLSSFLTITNTAAVVIVNYHNNPWMPFRQKVMLTTTY